MNEPRAKSLEAILQEYQQSFSAKLFGEESSEEDDLMLVFGLTQEMKAENKQYWGRELGMCWQRLVKELCRQKCENFAEGIREGKDEICDLVIGNHAIDTKYRIGSGDSGTLKKFKHYASRLQEKGYEPMMLILREDNLPNAIAACVQGGWTVKTGAKTYEYIQTSTGVDLQAWLKQRRNQYTISP
jgi:hypothetical protein